MPTFSITLTNEQVQLVQEARTIWNAQHGLSLSAEEFAKQLLGQQIRGVITYDAAEQQRTSKESELETDWPE